MRWIGLTGGIASGKSTVSQILIKLGFPLIDADQLAHSVVQPGSPGLEKIINHFGKSFLFSNGHLDRKQLGSYIFLNPEKKEELEAIIHPLVREQTFLKKKEFSEQNERICFNDVPLLFEKNLKKEYDKVVLVWCSPEIQIERIMTRNSLSREDAELRLKAQWPIDQKKPLADFIIYNDKDMNYLSSQVKKLIPLLYENSNSPV